jgi:hypothetical protein
MLVSGGERYTVGTGLEKIMGAYIGKSSKQKCQPGRQTIPYICNSMGKYR